MNITRFDDADRSSGESARSALADGLDTSAVALNWYQVPPGEGFPGGLHAHMDQEEIFAVIEGTATFETLHIPGLAPDGNRTERTSASTQIEAGQAIAFRPGEFQSGWNRGETDLRAIAIGVPRDTTDIRIPATCPDCSARALRIVTDADPIHFSCPSCGSVHVPAPCPDCGYPELTMTLDDGGKPIARCEGCQRAYDGPPLE